MKYLTDMLISVRDSRGVDGLLEKFVDVGIVFQLMNHAIVSDYVTQNENWLDLTEKGKKYLFTHGRQDNYKGVERWVKEKEGSVLSVKPFMDVYIPSVKWSEG